MERMLKSFLLGAVMLMLLSVCSSDAPSLAGDVRVAPLPTFEMVVTYPSEWYLAEENLTPNLGGPLEVFAIGSFPLRPGGPNCAQIPSQALHDLEPADVFVTMQERGTTDPSGFAPRPDSFEPTPGDTDHVFYECVEPEERSDMETMHWIWFTDQGRYFHVLVAIGRDAPSESVSAVWSTLDQLDIEPRG